MRGKVRATWALRKGSDERHPAGRVLAHNSRASMCRQEDTTDSWQRGALCSKVERWRLAGGLLYVVSQSLTASHAMHLYMSLHGLPYIRYMSDAAARLGLGMIWLLLFGRLEQLCRVGGSTPCPLAT